MFHPAAWLLAWFAYALSLQSLGVRSLLILALIAAGLAAKLAVNRFLTLLKRTRWLFVAVGAIYLLATPGEYLPGVAGMVGLTFEGLEQGGIQVMRLAVLLASLAILLQSIEVLGFLNGLHWLVSWLSCGRSTVVRLMLVLEYVEGSSKVSWSEWLKPGNNSQFCGGNERFVMFQTRFQWKDYVLVLVAYLLLGMVVLQA